MLDLNRTICGPSRTRVETQPSAWAKTCSMRLKARPMRSASRRQGGSSPSSLLREASCRVSFQAACPASTQAPTASARLRSGIRGSSRPQLPGSAGTCASTACQASSQGRSSPASAAAAGSASAASARSRNSSFIARSDHCWAQLSVSCSSRSWASSSTSTGASGRTWPKSPWRSTRSASSRAWLTMIRSAAASSCFRVVRKQSSKRGHWRPVQRSARALRRSQRSDSPSPERPSSSRSPVRVCSAQRGSASHSS